MTQIEKIVPKVLTGMQAVTTPIPHPKGSNVEFARWIGLKTFGDPELEKMVNACREWTHAFKARATEQPRWLSIIGNSGTGKTHCAGRLWTYAKDVSEWSKTTYTPMVIYWPGFVQSLKAGNAFGMRDDMKSWPVLFLDDIGAERDTSGFAADELNTLLGYRMNHWTLITSNKDIEGLKAIDGRISSRLIRGKNICVGVETMDYAEREA